MSEPAKTDMHSTVVPQGSGTGTRPPSTAVSSHISALINRQLEQGLPDLSQEKLLAHVSRLQVGSRSIPALGGIPLLKKLGKGGMGEVYLGLHPRLSHEVAVKILFPHLAEQQPELVQRLYREAQFAAGVKSPHLVSVLDVNEEAGLVYMVMEYIDGESAGVYRRRAGKLSEPEALDIMIGAAKGLAAAHGEGVVHRDIKPDNIMIPRLKGKSELDLSSAKLADLGLARSDGMGQSLTGSQSLMGTAGYMAPEQAIDAKKAQKPSDVFSMGATLFSLLTGRGPFVGETPTNVIMATINQPHTSLRELRTDVSDVTIALIDRCLAKDPAARFADGAELVAALQVCRTSFATPGLSAEQIKQRFSNLGAQPSTAVASPVPPLITESTIVAGGAARSASAATAAATAIAPAPKKSSGALALVGAALLAIIGIGGLFGFYAWRNADFETQRTALLEKAGSGLRASGPALSEAIESLAAFRRRNGWASEEQFQPVVDLQKKLSEREGVLAKRRSDFESMVSNARQLITADPEQAIEKLNAARDFGKENATDTLPDLNAALVPSIDETIKVAKGLIEKRIAEEAARERQRRRDDFRRLLGAAQSQADTGKWREAIDKAQEALKTLGEQPDEQIETANALLRTGKEELNRRAVYAEHVAEGQKALDEGRHDEAIVAFRKARETWKEAPDKTVEEGIAKAEAKLSERRFEAALGVAQEELGRGHYAEAQKALEVAGKERPNGKEIQELAKKIEQKQGEEKFMREMQEGEAQLKEGEYELAQKAFERACELRPNEKKPKQKAAEASARGLLKQGDVARDKGDKAAAEQLWNQALAAHPEMRDEVGERFSALRKDALAAELREIQALIKAQKFQDAQARAVNAQQTLGESKDLRDLAVALESLQRAKALGKKLQSSVDAAIAEAAGAVKVDDGDKKSAQIKSDLDTFSGDLGKRTGEIDLAFAEGKYAEMRNAVAELEKSSKTLQQQLLDAATYFDERAAKNVPKDGPSVGVGGFGGRRGVIGGLGANIPIGGGNAKKAARYNDIANNLKAIARDLP